MKDSYFSSRIQKALYQRNILLPITILLSLSVLVLCFVVCMKRERIVIIPANVTEKFWLEESRVSPSYLDQMSGYFASILLTKILESYIKFDGESDAIYLSSKCE